MLQFNPRELNNTEFEMLRELSAQISGYEPSEMWGKLTNEQMQGPEFYYNKIMNSKNQSDLHDKMYMYGEGFHKTLKHVLHVGSDIAKGTATGVNFLAKHPQYYQWVPFLNEVKPELLKTVGSVANEGSKALKTVAQHIHTKQGEPNLPNTKKQMQAGCLADAQFDKYGYGNKHLS